MSETLTALLLRLSEESATVRLWGAAARPHFGAAFDRLMSSGVIVEQERAKEWPPCKGCSCGASARPVLSVGDRLVAACPDDADCDLELIEEDLRRFAVDARRIVCECLGGVPAEVFEPTPMLWAREGAGGRYTCMTLQRAVVEGPTLASVLKQSMPATRVDLVAPPLAAQARLRLLSEAPLLTLIPVAEAVRIDELGRLGLSLETAKGPQPALRLRVRLGSGSVLVDGAPRRVPRSRMQLLEMLIVAWKSDRSLLAERISDKFSQRAAKGIVSELRNDLSKGHVDPAMIRNWIQTEHAPAAYRLNLPREQVEVTR